MIRLKARRGVALVLIDTFSWIVAIGVATLLRFEFEIPSTPLAVWLLFGILVAVFQTSASLFLGLYADHTRGASFDEVISIMLGTGLALIPTMVLVVFAGPSIGIPRSVPLIAAPFFLLFAGGARAMARIFRRFVARKLEQREPALIYGAGRMAELLITQLLEDGKKSYFPRGVVDDDPRKRGSIVGGVKVLGPFSEIRKHVSSTGASTLVVAVPRADSKFLQMVREGAEALDVKVMIIPTLSEILNTANRDVQLKELGIEDLVGRRAVQINSDKIRDYIGGATVLVTGAGGSIGSELCRQVLQHNPARLVYLDRDETSLLHTLLRVRDPGLLSNPDAILADIRDRDRISSIFEAVRPDVVFHAAALKHLPALELHPQEAWKTNVLGTLNVLMASKQSGVRRFVNVSTDKAAEPSSVLGHSKLIAERITAWFSRSAEGSYVSVRFGNVLGSRGSLVPILTEQINNGDKITVTDPGASRYFMTITEACQLVLQAGSDSDAESIFILDMGEPVRVLDIAKKMIEMSGKKIEIEISGLRPGEKLEEQLWSQKESLQPSDHRLIWKIAPQRLNPDKLDSLESKFR